MLTYWYLLTGTYLQVLPGGLALLKWTTAPTRGDTDGSHTWCVFTVMGHRRYELSARCARRAADIPLLIPHPQSPRDLP